MFVSLFDEWLKICKQETDITKYQIHTNAKTKYQIFVCFGICFENWILNIEWLYISAKAYIGQQVFELKVAHFVQ